MNVIGTHKMSDSDSRFHVHTDALLGGLSVEWQAGIDTVEHWDELSDIEQMVFIEEWAIPRGYFQSLHERYDRNELEPEQRARFEVMRDWIEAHRPEIEAVLEGPAT
jgi:hypothetical protein